MAGFALAPRVEAQQTGQGTGGEWKASYVFSGTSGGNTSYYVASDPDKGYVNVPFVFDTSTESYTTPFTVRYPYQSKVSAFASRGQSSLTSMGGAGEAHFAPTVKVVWDWVAKDGYANAGPVPDTLRFKVTGQASALTDGNSENVDRTSGYFYNADNNYKWNPADVWNGTATLQISGLNSSGGADGNLTTNQYGTSNNWNRKQTGLFSIETRGRTHIDDAAPITFDVKAKLKGERHLIMMSDGQLSYQPAAGYANAKGSVTATLDDRSVSISSSNIDASYRRTLDASQPLEKYRDQVLPGSNPDGSTIGESAAGLLNERDSSGAMQADSVAVWDGPSNQWMGQGIYSANTPNFTNPSLSWELSGGDPTGATQEELASGRRTINLSPYTGPYYDLNSIMLGGTASGSGIMGQTTLTLTATAEDGTEGENTYALNWHLPYEKEVDRADGPKMKELFWLSQSFMNANTSLQTEDSPARSFDALAMIDDVLVLGGAVGVPTEPISEMVSIYKALTNISKWTEEAPKIEVTATGHPNTRDAFSGALRHWPENIQGMDVETRDQLMQSNDDYSFSDYDVYVGRVRYHHSKSLLADKYDIHGFHSSNHVLSHDVTERIEFQNYYQIRGNSPTNPPTTGDAEVPPSYNVS